MLIFHSASNGLEDGPSKSASPRAQNGVDEAVVAPNGDASSNNGSASETQYELADSPFESALSAFVDEAQNDSVDEEFEPESEPVAEETETRGRGRRGATHAEEYVDFDRVFAQWKETGDPLLRERLILMHRHMVTYLARRFMERGDLFEDVVQVGMYGLINAVDSFDPSRGLKFSTFAIPSISGEIRRYFRDKVAGVRVPRHLQELSIRLQNRMEELTQELKRAPTYAEIAESLGVEVEDVVEAMELSSALDPASLDDVAYNDPGGESLADTIGGLDPQLEAFQEHAALQMALAKLSDQDRRVLELAYFEGFSQADIARRLKVSQMHISRVLRRALGQLRGLLEEP